MRTILIMGIVAYLFFAHLFYTIHVNALAGKYVRIDESTGLTFCEKELQVEASGNLVTLRFGPAGIACPQNFLYFRTQPR